MKIGLLGGSGQVGFDIRRAAQARHLALSAPSSSEVNLCDPKQVKDWVANSQCDAYINCAAYTAVDAAETDPEAAYATNKTGAQHLTRACAEGQRRVLYLSTDYVFDGNSTQAYTEHAPTTPMNVYGQSKLAGEQATLDYAHGQVLRVSWVFGVHGHNFVKSILRAALAGKPLAVVDDQFGTPCSARSVAAAALTLVQAPKQRDLYHLAASELTNWHTFAEAIVAQATECGLLDTLPPVTRQPTIALNQAARRPPHTHLDYAAITDDFDIAGSDWRAELKAVIEELQATNFGSSRLDN